MYVFIFFVFVLKTHQNLVFSCIKILCINDNKTINLQTIPKPASWGWCMPITQIIDVIRKIRLLWKWGGKVDFFLCTRDSLGGPQWATNFTCWAHASTTGQTCCPSTDLGIKLSQHGLNSNRSRNAWSMFKWAVSRGTHEA